MSVVDKFHSRFKANLRKAVRKSLLLDKISYHLMPPKSEDELNDPANIARTPIIFGSWLVIVVFGVFGLWSVLARIDSAAIAPGKVILDENRKSISHLEGGIVETIHENVGSKVKRGDPLITLREVRAKAQVDLLQSQLNSNLAIEARLIAERDKQEEIIFPDRLLKKAASLPELETQLEQAQKALDEAPQDAPSDELQTAVNTLASQVRNAQEVSEIINNQRRIFATRTENLHGQMDILKTRISKHEQEINGLQIQADSMSSQIGLLTEEISVVEKLVKEGNATRPRLLSLQRQRAELQGRQGEYMALKAKARENIDETKLTMLNTESEYMSKVVEELKQAQQVISEVNEKITASADVLDRVVIRAPVDGIVNDLTVHTEGGVIKPGEKILDIIPVSDEMTVEARVSPQDIDVVHEGLDARVRLTAFKTRQVPPVMGSVTFVSGDQYTDERTGQSYFLARIKINAGELEELGDVALSPGMPADVLIITGSRTFLAYLMDPITQSFQHSFRQQ
jgi:HlyD family secretion protein/epimerase transport system membrane fusion protein